MTEAQASVLVVDDDPINRALLAKTLERDGHQVTTAEDGEEGWELVQREAFDIVLLDVLMPKMDGCNVLEHIGEHAQLRHLPVIMISALDELETVVRCIELGALDYLPKPFNPVLLRARISAGLTKKRLHDLEQEHVRNVFSRFVPEQVVDEVLRRTDDDLRLAGVRRFATVLFADLRGFTTFAQAMPADLVIEVLNQYLTEMSDAILDNGGTLVAYLGDGIMAVFGAPIEADDHADRALAAAREIVDARLPRFNRWVADSGLGDGFSIGVGLNSGPVMSGTVGSARRLEYAAVGDTTNTAARLQAATKSTPHSILVADSTRESLRRRADDLAFAGELELRGKETKVKAWTLEAAARVTPPAATPPGRARARSGA
ncbi:MAG TPA: response regulator [Gaiellaceae bacterium]|nr:response regulator [Gaiellaceae bacterium]